MSTKPVASLCPYCGVGCGVLGSRDRDGRLEISGDPDYPVNIGNLCSKGRYLHLAAGDHGDRLLQPLSRDRDSGEETPLDWDTAMTRITDTVQSALRAHGPESVAFYISGQCLTEEYYLVNKIAKGFIGCNNVDTNSRLCMSSAVMGYKMTLGDDLVPTSYEDLDHCDCFLVAGANPSWCHPILWRRVEARKQKNPDAKIIVVDPRRTETCAFADLHLQILPGTDIFLFNAIAALLVESGRIDQRFVDHHCAGFPELRKHLQSMDLNARAKACGLDPQDILQAAVWIGRSPTLITMWTMGLNQSQVGTDKNIALIQLNLLRGAIGKPGCGPMSLTGQPNAMGGREVGGMATLLAAHHDMKNPEHREKIRAFWDAPQALSDKPGLTATRITEALEAGTLKVLWIIATNPSVSMPDTARWEAALTKADLVIVQDFSRNADALASADLILPAATWPEKEGVMTNTERRIGRLRRMMTPPGEARPDCDILLDFARRMGWKTQFAYDSVADVFAECAALTHGTDVDISGLSHALLDKRGSVQWPCPSPDAPGTPRLFSNHRFPTPDGRARLHAVTDRGPDQQPTGDFPLVLTTGRVRDQWHTMTRTGRVNRLKLQSPLPTLDMHPEDLKRFGLEDGWPAEIESDTGKVILRAHATTDLRPGVVFVPMHWGRKLSGGNGRINRLVPAKIDPVSLQPDFKHVPVRVRRPTKPRERIVVVGAGAGALQFVSRYRELNREDELLVIGREPRGFYNRILLPDYLTGDRSWESLETLRKEAEEKLDFTFEQGVGVVGINRERKVVLKSDGEECPYDKLILSTGSRPFVPPGTPQDMPRVFTMRTREDADRARAVLRPGSHVLIMGGGLLGIELAAALNHNKIGCTIVNLTPRLMQLQLDATAGALLREELESRGIRVLCGDAVETIKTSDDEGLCGAITRNGEEIDANMLFVAVGTRTNIEYLADSGVETGRGVMVNDHLQSSDPNIYAIGEIAEHRGTLYGITAGAQEQADIAARHLAGDPWSSYEGSTLFNILKIHGTEVRSAGMAEIPEGCEEDPDWEDVVFQDRRQRVYQRCILHRNRLVGAQFFGDVSPWQQCKQWMDSRIELQEERLFLLRSRGAEAKDPPRGRLVCTCNQVGELNLKEAMSEGVLDLETLCTRTRAGTGCGSCKPEVKLLLDAFNLNP
ncbi:MAG: molybdopterin-dependent oxidoreductase [Verrucomicrobia bacterium]|nr:molybdopterin-dependent oxidoreductase [Verrucomicrobiota bacterium]MCH8513962.1 molybdopterin-dependent oxidoreductase [Kiritimatiellia bacterium]